MNQKEREESMRICEAERADRSSGYKHGNTVFVSDADALFNAHARTALPAALDEIERLELEIAAARHALNLSIPSGTVDAWIETARLDLGAP